MSGAETQKVSNNQERVSTTDSQDEEFPVQKV